MMRHFSWIIATLCVGAWLADLSPECRGQELVPAKATGCLRVATFNVSLNRKQQGLLQRDLQNNDQQAQAIATIIRAVQPDILLLNELDWDREVDNAATFAERYLADDKPDLLGGSAWSMPHRFSAAVNTGVDSGMDINGNGKLSEPEDAWGYGVFPGQYGMAVLSRYRIEQKQVRTFQMLKWSSLPEALVPRDPTSQAPYYSPSVWQELRLSSKSHWDVPIATPLGVISILASHPTPPAFDGPADHNGCRNHDEVRLLADYIETPSSSYLVDDQGTAGGLATGRKFVIVGDLNSDPIDGDSRHAAITRLLMSPRVNASQTPSSLGAAAASRLQGKANLRHRAPPDHDTADFSDNNVGNLRVDYVLPSHDLEIQAAGVFWPDAQSTTIQPKLLKRLMDASDHHLVWIDVR